MSSDTKGSGTGTEPVDQTASLDHSFYRTDLADVEDPARTLLEKYSGIPSEKIVQHVKDVRDRAYAVFPYPCIGMFTFLDLDLHLSPCYREIVERAKKGEKFLDLACCFGQEIRKLVHEGVPQENIYGADLSADFINLGYELFLDKDKLQVRFIPTDIFDDHSELVTKFSGQMDIIHASNFFHLFDRATQVNVAKRVLRLLRPKPGSLIVGTQAGSTMAQNYTWGKDRQVSFFDNLTTWKELWDQVGRETGLQLQVDATEGPFGHQALYQNPPAGFFRLSFSVRLV